MKTKSLINKNIILFILFIIALISCNFIFHNIKFNQEAKAEGEEVISVDYVDAVLYDSLVYLKYGHHIEGEEDLEAYPLYENSFVSITSLDLKDKSLEYLDEDLYIEDIFGLSYFDFENLIQLDLSYNNISEIPTVIFESMPNLTTLIINNNEISEANFQNVDNLTDIDLQFNDLSNIDLSNLSADSFVNLSYNNFEKTTDIISNNSINILLFGNYIANSDNIPANFDLFYQYQSIYTEITEIKLYVSTFFPNVSIKFTNIVTEAVQTLSQDLSITLSVGQYNLTFWDEEENLSDTLDEYFTSSSLIVYKSSPNYEIYIDDEIVDLLQEKYTSNLTVKFLTNDENYTIQYKINNSEWINGNLINLTNTGRYVISLRCVYDDNISILNNFVIIIEKENDWWLSGIVMFLIIMLLALSAFVKKNSDIKKAYLKEKKLKEKENQS